MLLAVNMVMAMFRNWRHPIYMMYSLHRQSTEAKRGREIRKRGAIAFGRSMDIQTGLPIDPKKHVEDFRPIDQEFTERVKELTESEDSSLRLVLYLERGTLILSCLSILSLIVLAWLNF